MEQESDVSLYQLGVSVHMNWYNSAYAQASHMELADIWYPEELGTVVFHYLRGFWMCVYNLVFSH